MTISSPQRAALAVLLSALFAGCQDTTPTISAPDEANFTVSSDVVPGRFIVTLRSSANPRTLAREYGVQPDFVYEKALNGFAGALSTAAREGLLRDARVERIEPDGIVHASETQTGATWGLDRIDQASGTNGAYTYNATGAGVTAYIIDTGILYTHNEFAGRASFGFDAFGGSGVDCNGHGTHVAGTVGGTTYGVAKSVTLVGVRVLNCSGSGTTSGVIAGIDWVTANHAGAAVANMSLGGGASTSLDQAVANSITSGVSYAIAAGNGNQGGKAQNACNYSPARVPAAMTIGATNSSDQKASWSNYGSCVDWFAPGVGITSAWYSSTSATNTISGTSMATPHVTGVAALYLQGNPSATPAQVRDALYAATTKGIVTSSSTANNHLLYSQVGSAPGNAPPTANFTFACVDLACGFTDASSDSDGSVASRNWNFGDATSSTATNPSHTYGSSGTFAVTLTVTDDGGASGSVTKNVSVSEPGAPPADPIELSVVGYKVKGRMTADLTWSGATTATIDVWRKDGGAAIALVATVPNNNAYTDHPNYVGAGTLVYRVCEAGSTTSCSPDRAITF
jgi:subtilisin family serine protease